MFKDKSSRNLGIIAIQPSSQPRRGKMNVLVALGLLSILFIVSQSIFSTEDVFRKGISLSSSLSLNQFRQYCGESDFVCRIEQAKDKFHTLSTKQSKSVEEAIDTYRNRYKREPPPGFGLWVEFALSHDSLNIDNYDQMEADLAPFRKAKLSKAQIQSRIQNALRAQRQDDIQSDLLGTIKVIKGQMELTGRLTGAININSLNTMLEPIGDRLPDMEILFNWYSEPRILGESTERERDQMDDDVTFEDYSRQSTCDLVTKACPSNHLTKDSALADRPSVDICKVTRSTLCQQHGVFLGPNTFEMSDTLLPLISRAKLSTMRDILAPNPCYVNNWYRKWTTPDHTPFRNKDKSLYWRGKTTGVYMDNLNWNKGHRQRFVSTMQMYKDISTTLYGAFEPMQKDATTVALSNLPPETFDANFTIKTDCESGACESFDAKFALLRQDKPWFEARHQLTADIDGDSMSCRFYRQLQSNSVPLKQTIWAEWHDDWMIPWYHYIPITLDMKELPVLLDWLLNTDEGQDYSEIISEAGMRLAEEALRPIDFTIYYYRLLLEYASLYQ